MKNCPEDEIGLKSYFLGPQAENAGFLLSSILEISNQYAGWRKSLFPFDGQGIGLTDQTEKQFLINQKLMQNLLKELSHAFEKEVPQFSPRYLGHMFSELSLPGLLGHIVALLHNPNNISLESSHVGLKIEKEAIHALSKMLHWKKGFGHFTSGGTIANLEALLRMRSRIPKQDWPKAKLLTSAAAHYSWKKNLKIIGFPESAIAEIPLDKNGRMSTQHLKNFLNTNKDPILGLVSLFGSTESGTVDDIESINKIIKGKIWHHTDAAFGGFFACTEFKDSYMKKQKAALKKINSLTLDPHKLGYVPYGCGAFLCQKQKDYIYAEIDAPYIQFKSGQEVGVQSIEGSRPATGASATWLTAKTLGFHKKGLGKVLERQLMVKRSFQQKLTKNIKGIQFAKGLDLNIMCWTLPTKSKKLTDSNKMVDQLFTQLSDSKKPYYVSKTVLHLEKHWALAEQLEKSGIKINSKDCHVIRMTLMNPFIMTKNSQTQFIEDFIFQLKRLF